MFFGYSSGGPLVPRMTYGTLDRTGRVTRFEAFEAPYCSMVHDFAVTERHVLFPVLPLTGSLPRAMNGGPPFAWEPALGGHIGLIRRAEGVASLRWFRAESCYVFHVLNAWEDGEKIVADVMQYDAPPLFPLADGSAPTGDRSARLVRWTLDPAAGTDAFSRTPLDDLAGEFPRLDERRAGLRNRYGTIVAKSAADGMVDTIAWFDLAAGRRTLLHPPRRRRRLGAGVRAARAGRRGGRWLAARGGVARRRASQRPHRPRDAGRRSRAGRDRATRASRPVRLPRQLRRPGEPAMNILLGLAPFIAFFALARSIGAAAGLWAAAAIAVALLARARLRGQTEVKVLEAGAAVLFVALAVVASFVRPDWSLFEVRVVVDLGLVAITLGSILVGRPFTLQYAREQVPQERWTHPLFIAANRRISAVWTLAFVVETVCSALIAWAPGIPPMLPLVANVLALAGAAAFTVEYPKRLRTRYATANG